MTVDVGVLLQQIASFIAVYVIVTIGLNIKAGSTGIPDFGHAMFFGMGGIAVGNLVAHLAVAIANAQGFYEVQIGDVLGNNTLAILVLNKDYLALRPLESIVLVVFSLILAALLGGLLGLLASYPGLRLRGEYLAILLLAVAEALRIFTRYTTWVMGDEPTVGLTALDLFAWTGNSELAATIFSVIVAIGVFIYAERLHNSPLGRLLRAVRDEEDAARALGKDIAIVRRNAMIIGSAIAGIAGAVYSLNPWLAAGAIASESIFNRVLWTFWPWALMILGGMASNRGIALAVGIVGIALLWPIRVYKSEITSMLHVEAVGIDPGYFANALEFLLLGALIIAVIFLMPRGIIPEQPSYTLDFNRIALEKGIPPSTPKKGVVERLVSRLRTTAKKQS